MSFEPHYGEVKMLGGIRKGDDNDTVRNKGDSTFLLKQIQPTVQGSAKPTGRHTEKTLPRKLRIQERAAELEEHVRMPGGRMAVSVSERAIRRGLTRHAKSVQTKQHNDPWFVAAVKREVRGEGWGRH